MITSIFNVREKNANVFAYIKIKKKIKSRKRYLLHLRITLILAHKRKTVSGNFLFVHGKFD